MIGYKRSIPYPFCFSHNCLPLVVYAMVLAGFYFQFFGHGIDDVHFYEIECSYGKFKWGIGCFRGIARYCGIAFAFSKCGKGFPVGVGAEVDLKVDVSLLGKAIALLQHSGNDLIVFHPGACVFIGIKKSAVGGPFWVGLDTDYPGIVFVAAGIHPVECIAYASSVFLHSNN